MKLLKAWSFKTSSAFWAGFRLKGYWSSTSAFSSKIIRHIMHMIKTHIVKIQSQNLMHDHRLLAVAKISFQMIQKTKILNRIIQSKMIPVYVQTWTGIGLVCRNIGPIMLFFTRMMKHSWLKEKQAFIMIANVEGRNFLSNDCHSSLSSGKNSFAISTFYPPKWIGLYLISNRSLLIHPHNIELLKNAKHGSPIYS